VSSRQLVVLGTSSQAPTRYRAHNGFVLRWDDQMILFDPGEGTQRQFIFAGVSVARLTAICITHFHGDHSLGLAGVVQRRALDSRTGASPLPVFFPADGIEYFERLRSASIFYDTSGVVPQPISEAGVAGMIGSLELRADYLSHRVTTLGYRLTEPPRRHVNTETLAPLGISGPDIGRVLRDGSIQTPHGLVTADDISAVGPGQSMAFVMDTAPCEAAVNLARDVDLLVAESTYLDSEVELAARYRHLTAGQAASIARQANARRLVLGHFSARYRDNSGFATEAGAIHPDVVVAEDLAVIAVPSRKAN